MHEYSNKKYMEKASYIGKILNMLHYNFPKFRASPKYKRQCLANQPICCNALQQTINLLTPSMLIHGLMELRNNHNVAILYFLIHSLITFIIKKIMLKVKGKNFDNVSVAYTKSSKTLKSKLNNNPEIEIKKFTPPYFKEDNIHRQIQERVKKQNSKFGEILVKKKNYNHLDKAGQIVKELMNRHKLTQEKLSKLKQQSEKQKQVQCPFQPNKKKVQKYVIQGDVVRRNQLWLQQKRRKSMIRKEQFLDSDLSQCTFSPDIANKQSSLYLKNRAHSKSTLSKPKQYAKSPSVSPGKRKDLSRQSFQSAKQQIYYRLLTMSDFNN